VEQHAIGCGASRRARVDRVAREPAGDLQEQRRAVLVRRNRLAKADVAGMLERVVAGEERDVAGRERRVARGEALRREGRKPEQVVAAVGDEVDAVRRELWEETGLSVQATRLLLIESSKEIHKVGLTYLCTGASGTFIPNDEVSVIQYFDTGALPVFPLEQKVTIEKALAILKSEGK